LTSLLFVSSFVYYLYGLSGTVPAYRDSGDLIASIHTLGIAHPPGYAFYILLGKLFVTVLPFGNVAYRVNVMSAFFAAAAVAMLYKVLVRICHSDGPAYAGVTAVLFATSPAVVALARVAEMYTLSACLAAMILFCLLSEDPRGMAWAALLLGLGLSVHPTLIFLAPLFAVQFPRGEGRWEIGDVSPLPHHPSPFRPILFFLLGLSVLLYLPIRAAQHPLLNWGDPSHWRNFWRVVTRADYGGLKLHPEESVLSWTPHSLMAQMKYFLTTFNREWGWVAVLVGVLGLYGILKDSKNRRWGAALFIAWLLAGPGFFVLSNLPLTEATTPAILQPYLLLAGILWAPFVVSGIQVIASLVPNWQLVPAVAVVLLLAARPWGWTSDRNDFYTYDFARNLLRSLPPGSILYDPDDPTTFSIQVLQTVEKRRSDVILLNFFRTRWGYEQIKRRWPDLLPPIPMDNGQELQSALWSYSARKFSFYAELPQKLGSQPYCAEGLAYAAQVSPHAEDDAKSRERAETLFAIYPQRGDFVTTHHPDFFTRHIISYYAAAENNLGIEYANAGEWARAARHYQRALEIEPDQSAAQYNLGIALSRILK
jgi:hypothetical protein